MLMFVFELFSKLNNSVFNFISTYQINACIVWIAFNTFADGQSCWNSFNLQIMVIKTVAQVFKEMVFPIYFYTIDREPGICFSARY